MHQGSKPQLTLKTLALPVSLNQVRLNLPYDGLSVMKTSIANTMRIFPTRAYGHFAMSPLPSRISQLKAGLLTDKLINTLPIPCSMKLQAVQPLSLFKITT